MEGYSNITVAKESNSEITYQLTWQMLPQKFKEKYIEYHQGDTVLNYEAQVGLTLFYVLLLLIGLPGNLMTCIIIWCNSNKMTPTNCFLLNLAIVDIITLMTGKYSVPIFKKSWGLSLNHVWTDFCTILSLPCTPSPSPVEDHFIDKPSLLPWSSTH